MVAAGRCSIGSELEMEGRGGWECKVMLVSFDERCLCGLGHVFSVPLCALAAIHVCGISFSVR